MVSLARSCECLEPSQDRLRLDADYFNSNDDHYSPNVYIKNITQTTMLADFDTRHNGRESFSPKLVSSDLIYNLTDVGKYLPKIDEKSVEIITRKRKERQDSGSSLIQDCKVTRSNSEERQIEVKTLNVDNIRRVSSHEDFEKCKRPLNRVQAAPLHEQNYDNTKPVRKSPSQTDLELDQNAAIDPGEKYSNIFGDVHNDSPPPDSHAVRYRYNKSDSSPSRSRIHEYILFPKRISPNRDPKAVYGGNIYSKGWSMSSGDGERDHERLRCSERRSRNITPRGRRPQQRRQLKYRMCDENESKASKENDVVCIERFPLLQKEKLDTIGDNFSEKLEETNSKINDAAIPLPFTSKERLETLVDLSGTETPKKLQPFEFASGDKSHSPIPASPSLAKSTPLLDFKTLQEQIGTAEPIPSVPKKYAAFPWMTDDTVAVPIDLGIDTEPLLDDNYGGYNKEIIYEIRSQKRTLPDKCQSEKPEPITGYPSLDNEERVNRISKKIQVLKRKISKSESEFELSHGYKASHSEKSNDRNLNRLYSEVRRLKNEKKLIKTSFSESLSRPIAASSTSNENSIKNKPITEIMVEIEKRLEMKREAHGRPAKLEDCTHAQLAEEKAAVQRALLWLEGARGRPTARIDRDAARPLYDRYRAVKRLVAKFDAMKITSSTGELATILEHEPMLFNTLQSPSQSPETSKRQLSDETPSQNEDSSPEKKDNDDPTSSLAKSTASDDANTNLDETPSNNENLHCLSLNELTTLLHEAKALKASLRKKIKSLEADFELQNSKKLLKEEKSTILPMYNKYKETKARLRLLSALVNKQKKV